MAVCRPEGGINLGAIEPQQAPGAPGSLTAGPGDQVRHGRSPCDVSGVSKSRTMRPWTRVEVLTPEGVLDRTKKLGVVKEMTDIIAEAAGDPGLAGLTSPD
jgi:hypothetical protein